MNFVDNPIPNVSDRLPLGLASFLTGKFWQQSFPTSLSSKIIILVHFIFASFHIHSVLKAVWPLFMVFLKLRHHLCKMKKLRLVQKAEKSYSERS